MAKNPCILAEPGLYLVPVKTSIVEFGIARRDEYVGYEQIKIRERPRRTKEKGGDIEISEGTHRIIGK